MIKECYLEENFGQFLLKIEVNLRNLVRQVKKCKKKKKKKKGGLEGVFFKLAVTFNDLSSVKVSLDIRLDIRFVF